MNKIELKTDGIQFKSSKSESFIKWDYIHKLHQNQHYLLVNLSLSTFFVIPRLPANSDFDMETFAKTIESKASLIKKNVKKTKSKQSRFILIWILYVVTVFWIFHYFEVFHYLDN